MLFCQWWGPCLSAALTILHLYVTHPTGDFLTVGDRVFSMEGLKLDLSVPNIPSSQSEELHQQCVLPHLSQNSQYFPRNLLSCSTSPSSSMWGIAAAYMGSVKTWGGYPNPWPAGTSVFRCIIFGLHVCHLVGCFPLSGLNITSSNSLFPHMILFHPGVNVLDHAEFSPCSFNFYLYF